MSPTSCQEKVHESAEAANRAFVADAKQINTHHASVQNCETVQQKLSTCRHLMDDEEENMPALQDGSVSGTDYNEPEVDMFDDFSGLRQQTEMANQANQAFAIPPGRKRPVQSISELSVPSGDRSEEDPEDEALPQNHGDPGLGKGRGRKGGGKGIVKGRGPGMIPSLPVKPSKPSKGTNAELTLSKAAEALSKYELQFSDSKLWDGKVKSRSLDTMSNALNRHASQIMCLNLQDPDDIALATRCSEFPDTVAEKVKFLQDVRQAPEQSASAVTDSHYTCAKTMSVQVLSDVIAWVAGQLLKDFDQDLLFVDCRDCFVERMYMSLRTQGCFEKNYATAYKDYMITVI